MNIHARPSMIALGDVELELQSSGRGPALLLLHATDGVEGMAGLIEQLSADFTVYAPSHPGFGGSSRPQDLTAVDDIAYLYLDLLDVLDLRAVTLVGVSLGGWIACELMIKDCSRIGAAVLGAPLGLRGDAALRESMPDIFSLPPADVQACLHVRPPPLPRPGERSERCLTRAARATEAAALYGWSPYLHNPKLRRHLNRIACPTLLAWGEEDALLPGGHYRAFQSAIPGAEAAVLEDCGHFVHSDRPSAFAGAIRSFRAAVRQEARA